MQLKTFTKFPKSLTVGGKQALYFFNTIPHGQITLKKNADLTLICLATEGWPDLHNFIINAKERGAKCECIFFILGKNNNSFSAKIEARHSAPHTKIRIMVRAGLTDRASCHIEGDCRIEKNARGASTYFSHHTLLLSDEAKAKTSPNLEIKTDDVKAGHSASVGKIDEDAIFYLCSRGLSEAHARSLLVQGFFEAELANIPDTTIQDAIRTAVNNFLG
ncbi:MAG: SufD family Fe-S cluster assembly protein [Candidatus Magasanikbacteria bacterium]|nr:SufD family Fe-S cluster assembly protein [Candidatus Magasanikbacteria bacterium]